MKKGMGTPENRELAFRVYALFGGRNIPRILERLEREHGLRISAKTLYEWKREDGWEGRMAREGEMSQPQGAGVLTFEERMLRRMTGLIERYEGHFKTKGVSDSQAAYAYTSLVRAALELSRRMKPWESRDLGNLRDKGGTE